MDELDNLDVYNGDAVHDMCVDFDNYVNTCYPEVFYEDNPDDDVDN